MKIESSAGGMMVSKVCFNTAVKRSLLVFSAMAILATGCGLRYTVPKDLIRRLPKSSRKSVFQARTVVTIAIDKRASVRRKIASTKREVERTKERIEDIENKIPRTPVKDREKLYLEKDMLEAKLDYLDEKLDHLDFLMDKTSKELMLAKAKFELSKAKLIKKHAIEFSEDIEDFEEQVRDLEEDVKEYKSELEEREKALKAEEAKWLAAKEKYYAAVGEAARGWWTEQEESAVAAQGEKVVEGGKKAKKSAKPEKEEKPVDRVLKKMKAIVRDDFRVAFRFGDTIPFVLGTDEVTMSMMFWTLDLEADYFLHPNFPLFVAFSPGLGQSLRKGEEDERITALPFLVGMRYQDAEGTVLPYVGFAVGTQVVFGDRETKKGVGFTTNLNLGMDIRIGRTWSLTLEAGAKYGQMQLEFHKETDYSEPQRTRKTFNVLGGYFTAGAAARF